MEEGEGRRVPTTVINPCIPLAEREGVGIISGYSSPSASPSDVVGEAIVAVTAVVMEGRGEEDGRRVPVIVMKLCDIACSFV